MGLLWSECTNIWLKSYFSLNVHNLLGKSSRKKVVKHGFCTNSSIRWKLPNPCVSSEILRKEDSETSDRRVGIKSQGCSLLQTDQKIPGTEMDEIPSSLQRHLTSNSSGAKGDLHLAHQWALHLKIQLPSKRQVGNSIWSHFVKIDKPEGQDQDWPKAHLPPRPLFQCNSLSSFPWW